MKAVQAKENMNAGTTFTGLWQSRKLSTLQFHDKSRVHALPLVARFCCLKASQSACQASIWSLRLSALAFSAAEKCSAGVMRSRKALYFRQSSNCSSSLFSSLLITAACVLSRLISMTCKSSPCHVKS